MSDGNTSTPNSSPSSAVSLAYDGTGNPTGYQARTLTYDPASRMLNDGGGITSAYDAEGLRAERVVGTAATYFLYDGGEPVEETDSSGTMKAFETQGANGRASRRS